jgi:YegS/Rv2252/BmrU family lipid kinase
MSPSDGWVFIVNPIAGVGYGAACAETVRQMMKKHGAHGEVVLTQAKGHASELAAEYATRGFPRIVAVGGDGTMSEVVQPLVGRAGVTFGGVPAGTGNDFIHMLGFPDRLGDADWETLFRGSAAMMDVGRCNGRYFINGMGLGFDAHVAAANYHVDEKGEAVRGKGSNYMWMIIKALLTYREKPMRVTLQGRTESKRGFLNTIANGRRLAGGMYLTPRALADDGLLDVCMCDALSLPMRFKELLSVTRRTHLADSVMHYYQVDGIRYEFDAEVPAHADGELFFSSQFRIDVVPGALRTLINPEGDHYFRRV